MKKLKDIFLSSNKILFEDTMRQSNDSVDSILDSIMLGYKSDSLQEGKLDKIFSLLLEELPDDAGDEESPPPDETTGDDDLDSEEPAPTRVPKIDIDQFAQKVVNLSDNYQNLVDIKSIIINRSMKVLSEAGYDQATIMKYKTILENEFGIKMALNGFATETDNAPMPPPAIGAGPDIGG